MASITLRNLDDALETHLRVRATGDGGCMEEEQQPAAVVAVGLNPSSRALASTVCSHSQTASGFVGGRSTQGPLPVRGWQGGAEYPGSGTTDSPLLPIDGPRYRGDAAQCP